MTYPQFEYGQGKALAELAAAHYRRECRRKELAEKGWITVPNVPLPEDNAQNNAQVARETSSSDSDQK